MFGAVLKEDAAKPAAGRRQARIVLMKEAAFWEPMADNSVRCTLCFHACRIANGQAGFCGVRLNRAGRLVTLVDDNVVSLSLDPIEKKPLFHFLPGSGTLSLGTYGCNFSCLFCQNYGISRAVSDTGRFQAGQHVTPEALCDYALAHGIKSISFTYNEPTVFYELLHPAACLARDKGLRTIMVTNGSMSSSCLASLAPVVSAANVDLKSWNKEFYAKICHGSRDVVLENLKSMKKAGWWLEITTLLIPGLNDSEQELRSIAAFIRDELGPETPWHVSAFFPTYRMTDRPATPPETVAQACRYGREEGLFFVYGGNVASSENETTLCPHCHAACTIRRGFRVLSTSLGHCPECGTPIAGIWE